MTTTDRATLEARTAAWLEKLHTHDGPHEVACWGRDGWDTAEWPYIRYWITAQRVHRNTYRYAARCTIEGDRYTFRTEDPTALVAWLETRIHDGWMRRGDGPDGFNPDAPADIHRGPFTWSLLD